MELPTLSADRQVLADHVERVVSEKTRGMIRGLRVEVRPGEVILSGRARTYYAKQLATHAVLDAIEDAALTNAIEVL